MTSGDVSFRTEQRASLLRFAAGARHPWGFAHLDDAGEALPDQPVHLYVTARMTHVFAMGLLGGEAPAPGGPDQEDLRSLVEHGVEALLAGPLWDSSHGGWYARVHPDGTPEALKESYGHAHVILAASSAARAGVARAEELLNLALAVHDERFWDESAGLVVEEWDPAWTELSEYRGMNSNMHTVECYLAAGDVTGDSTWHARAGRMAARLTAWASENQWRVPEHFNSDWEPLLDYNRDRPADPFRPYGATVGHGLEWARLLVQTDAALGADAPEGLVEAGIALADRAIADGWSVDGADGFIYTTDWDGEPIVRARMHWVVCEAIATSEVLRQATGDQRRAEELQRWWDYVAEYLVDRELGSWHHELSPTNQPQQETWAGKPDAYHTYQALWIQDLPMVPSFASAIAVRR